MAVAELKFITEEEYLAREEAAEYKHEYYMGQIFAMAGGTPEHSQIAGNCIRELGILAKNRRCVVYTSDLRIRIESTGLNTYPDASMVCGALRTTNDKPVAVLNPVLIVEVLSESTREYDRGEKWLHYRTIKSLKEYILIWQDRPLVEQFIRQDGGEWTYRLFEGLESSVALQSVDGDLPLMEICSVVTFPPKPVLRESKRHEPLE